jgi:hypothetical protein
MVCLSKFLTMWEVFLYSVSLLFLAPGTPEIPETVSDGVGV